MKNQKVAFSVVPYIFQRLGERQSSLVKDNCIVSLENVHFPLEVPCSKNTQRRTCGFLQQVEMVPINVYNGSSTQGA